MTMTLSRACRVGVMLGVGLSACAGPPGEDDDKSASGGAGGPAAGTASAGGKGGAQPGGTGAGKDSGSGAAGAGEDGGVGGGPKAGASGTGGAGTAGESSGTCPGLPAVDDYAATGPFDAKVFTNTGPDGTYYLFRPDVTLGQDGFKHPVAVWGNGISTTPDQYQTLLGHIASH